jgi:hypothetical protein
LAHFSLHRNGAQFASRRSGQIHFSAFYHKF